MSQTKNVEPEELESYLWERPIYFGGSIDSADYKSYTFGLLFRINDCANII